MTGRLQPHNDCDSRYNTWRRVQKKNKLYLFRLPNKCRMAEKPFIITVLGSGIQIINIPMVVNWGRGQRVSYPLALVWSEKIRKRKEEWENRRGTNGWSRECQTFLKPSSELIENFALSTFHSYMLFSLSLYYFEL